MTPGETIQCGLFGWPVGHSISPEIHNAAFAIAGLDWEYRSYPVRPEELAGAFRDFRSRGGRGLNITIPHKVAVMELLDRLDDRARLIGAVNTVLFRDGTASGFNTDGPGFIRSVEEELGFSFAGKTVAVFGAGGAGRAVAVSAALEGARVEIADLDRGRAADLSDWINREVRPGAAGSFDPGRGAVEDDRTLKGAATPDGVGLGPRDERTLKGAATPDGVGLGPRDDRTLKGAATAGGVGLGPRDDRTLKGAATAGGAVREPDAAAGLGPRIVLGSCDLAVDATGIGLRPSGPLSFDPGLLSPGAAVVDLVYNPPETPLLRAARDRGLKTLNGLGMLVRQAALSWEIWTGREAPVGVMKSTALRALARRAGEG